MKTPFPIFMAASTYLLLLVPQVALALAVHVPAPISNVCPNLSPGTYRCSAQGPRKAPQMLLSVGLSGDSGTGTFRNILLGINGQSPVTIPCGSTQQENIFCSSKERLADSILATECNRTIGASYLIIAIQSHSNSSQLDTRLDVMTRKLQNNEILSFLTTRYKIEVFSRNSFRFFASYSGNLTSKEEASATDVFCRL